MCRINEQTDVPYFRGASWFGPEGQDHVGKLLVLCADDLCVRRYMGERTFAALYDIKYKEKTQGRGRGWKVWTGWGQYLGMLNSEAECVEFRAAMQKWQIVGVVTGERADLPPGNYEMDIDTRTTPDGAALMWWRGELFRIPAGQWSFIWSREKQTLRDEMEDTLVDTQSESAYEFIHKCWGMRRSHGGQWWNSFVKYHRDGARRVMPVDEFTDCVLRQVDTSVVAKGRAAEERWNEYRDMMDKEYGIRGLQRA